MNAPKWFRDWLPASKGDIDQLKEEIMAKLSELQNTLAGVLAKLDEGFTELTTEIQRLKEQLGDAEIPADAQATLNSIVAKANALADVIQPPAPPA